MKKSEFKKAIKMLNVLEQNYNEYSYFVKIPKNCICIKQVIKKINEDGV